MSASILGPVRTPLHSCAEPKWWIKYGKRAASESVWYGSFSLVRQKPQAAESVALFDTGAAGDSVAAAGKRSHQWCLTLTPNDTKTIERMTCRCFLRPIRRELTSSSYTTGWFSTAEPIHTVNLYFFLTTPLVSLRISPGAYNRRFTVFGGHSFSVFIVSISVPIHCWEEALCSSTFSHLIKNSVTCLFLKELATKPVRSL